MNLKSSSSSTNQSNSSLPSLEAEWIPPTQQESDLSTNKIIPLRIGQLLSLQEVIKILEYHKGGNIRVLNLDGRADLAKYMIFVTGNNIGHLRKMGDSLVYAVYKYIIIIIIKIDEIKEIR